MRGLIIKKEFLDLIFSGKKVWEIRGRKTRIKERVGLIESGSGKVMGEADIDGCEGPLTLAQLKRNARKIGARANEIDGLRYENTFAWVIKRPSRYRKPKPYNHPVGAVIWVKL